MPRHGNFVKCSTKIQLYQNQNFDMTAQMIVI